MSKQLFAFQVAKPIEAATEETNAEAIDLTYDPQAQAMVWEGGTDAQASHFCINYSCTGTYWRGGRAGCNYYYSGCCYTYGYYYSAFTWTNYYRYRCE